MGQGGQVRGHQADLIEASGTVFHKFRYANRSTCRRDDRRVAQMPSTNPSSSVIVDQLTRALGEAVIRIWSNLPQEVQDHLFKEAVASQGDSIRSQLAVFLHGKHSRTSDPLGDPREMKEPDSLGG